MKIIAIIESNDFFYEGNITDLQELVERKTGINMDAINDAFIETFSNGLAQLLISEGENCILAGTETAILTLIEHLEIHGIDSEQIHIIAPDHMEFADFNYTRNYENEPLEVYNSMVMYDIYNHLLINFQKDFDYFLND